ncbi:MAG: hypothetical protein JSW11_08645 [Candidatus Heimdallarchaeota archaeon]|nr:MAG: hypothetical protein JSW11_08645 [Candidatus Heimdallarchaeota archaeon]
MRSNKSSQDFLKFLEENYQILFAIIAAFLLFLSNIIFTQDIGLYMAFTIITILIEVMVGSIFLLFNTTSLILALVLQEGLSPIEKRWVQQKTRKNLAIIVIWLLFSIFTFIIIAPNFGIIAGIYLIALIFIFKLAGTEENPFLERRYEI